MLSKKKKIYKAVLLTLAVLLTAIQSGSAKETAPSLDSKLEQRPD